jgi:hypothetical protein
MALLVSPSMEVLMTTKPHDLSDLYRAHTFVLGIPAGLPEYLEGRSTALVQP